MEGLLGLADELLLKILHSAGAPAVARAATLCRRLRHVQQQLAALPAFASAAVIEDDQEVEECVRGAVKEALAAMPAAVDVCLLFVAGGQSGRARGAGPLAGLVPLCQGLLPPGALVVGCCGRGLFGVQAGAAVELDPSQAKWKGASVLLGRLPGSRLRAFAAEDAPAGGWASPEACRPWLGLGPGDVPPAVCLLFAHPSAGGQLPDGVEGLGAAFPGMVLTGGISSGASELFCSQPLPPRPDAEQGAGAVGGGGKQAKRRGTEGRRPRYVGLLVCRQQREEEAGPGAAGAGGDPPRCAGLTAQGMEGAEPLLTELGLIRQLGTLQHPGNEHDEPEEIELLGLSSALTARGDDATHLLHRLARRQMELGLWAAERAELGSFDTAASAGGPVALLQLYGVAEDSEALATAHDAQALEAVLAKAQQPGQVLCAQPLRLSAQGACRALEAGVGQLAAALPDPHPLLPTHSCGLVAVSCTAKGRQMFKDVGVEAGAIHAATRGLPLAGVYCDGEIGPTVLNAKSALHWAGDGSGSGSAATSCAGQGGAGTRHAGRSTLQGFTTILTALSGAN